MDDTDYDLLDALLQDCNLESQSSPMVVDEPIVQKPVFKFNCTEDIDTYYPDVVARRRYGGYKPPKPPKVKFINPFEKKVETPIYSKQLYDSMERIRLRESDKKDTKIKYIKKKYPD